MAARKFDSRMLLFFVSCSLRERIYIYGDVAGPERRAWRRGAMSSEGRSFR